MAELKLISEAEYKLDSLSYILFEDEHSLSFANLEIESLSLKFSWNSKGVGPEVKTIEGRSLIFIGIDNYVIGYNYRSERVVFFINTSTNLKWFDSIINGIAVVVETGVIIVNTTHRCTLRNCIFFGDLIMDTKVEKDKIRVSFLSNDDEIITL